MDLSAFKSKQRNKKEWAAIKREFRLGLFILMGMMALMGAVVWVDSTLGMRLTQLGIEPRSWSGLPAIFYGHFIHLDSTHYFVNMFAFGTLGFLVLMRDIRDFVAITGITMLVSGFSVWLLGGEVTRVGSGLLICGYLGYMLVFGLLEKSVLSIIISVGVAIVFLSSALGAINPFTTGSWIGCVSALMTGAVVGRFMVKNFRSHLTNSVTD